MNPRRGFTLLEVLIGFALLGIGMIMLAAIFPAALLEHSRTMDNSRALDLAIQAETMLHKRINPKQLYVDNLTLAAGFDSPWFAIPFDNMAANGTPELVGGQPTAWDSNVYTLVDHDGDGGASTPNVYRTLAYYAGLNGANDSALYPIQLFGVDYLTDSVLPRTDEATNKANNRLVWHGFYRTMASGTQHFAVAVCKQRQNKEYARQDVTLADPYAVPRVLQVDLEGNAARPRTRFPVPWRVTVSRIPNSQILTLSAFNNAGHDLNPSSIPADGALLSEIAPRGTKMLIHGRTYTIQGSGVLDFPGGRVLSVVDTDGLNRVQVLEDVTDIPSYNASADGFRFDVWLFPPPVLGEESFEDDPPLLEWKVSL